MDNRFDIVVIGAGHAGCEAALAGARSGFKTLLLSLSTDNAAQMSCNPAIGGLAKGHLVREIDALGGEMAVVTDATAIQFRMLNRSKGPAVWSPRSQNDRFLYSGHMVGVLNNSENLFFESGEAVGVHVEGGSCSGVILSTGETIAARAVIVTCGTFLGGKIFRGRDSVDAGRIDEPPAVGLTEDLNSHGIRSGRLKTGTPPRIDRNSVDWAKFTRQDGDEDLQPFSYRSNGFVQEQVPCYLGFTSEETHDILREGFTDSPMFSGRISGIGPRYCPSVEDKINRFPDKDKHQLFLEPEGLKTDLVYVNGFSTSLPTSIQERALRTVPGLENVNFLVYGYAIEYDYFPPDQLNFSLESNLIDNLYFAGQVNGTSGYEEAAAQGLYAGLNAALKLKGEPPFLLRRDEAYLGVLIDDIITKPIDEPYRMFTSRAESRLMLRQDNADERLMKYGHGYGLISEALYDQMLKKVETRNRLIGYLEKKYIQPNAANGVLESVPSAPLKNAENLRKILKRPEITLEHIAQLDGDYFAEKGIETDSVFAAQVEMEVKYEGYIERLRKQSEKYAQLENAPLPADLDYSKLDFISMEAREKLNRFRPGTLSQASRIAGISVSDIMNLMIWLKNSGKLQ